MKGWYVLRRPAELICLLLGLGCLLLAITTPLIVYVPAAEPDHPFIESLIWGLAAAGFLLGFQRLNRLNRR